MSDYVLIFFVITGILGIVCIIPTLLVLRELGNLEPEKRRRNRILTIVVSALIVVGGGLCGSSLIMYDLRDVHFEQSQMMNCNDFQTPENLRGIEPGAKLLIVKGRSHSVTPHSVHFDLPDDLRADSSAEVDYLICTDLAQRVIENCLYTDGSSNNRIRRFYDIYAVDPETGTSVAHYRVYGERPRECPETRISGPGSDYTGKNPPSLNLSTLQEILDSFYSEG